MTTGNQHGRKASRPASRRLDRASAQNVGDRAFFAEQWEAARDPAIVAAVSRHMRTLATLVTGTRGGDLAAPAPLISAGFENTAEEAHRVHSSASHQKRDILHLAFNLESQKRPAGLWVAYRENGGTSLYSVCWPWMSSIGGRAIVTSVFGTDQKRVRFDLPRGAKMKVVEGWPADVIDDGVSRAAREWERLAASDQPDDEAVAHIRRIGRQSGFGIPHLVLGIGGEARSPTIGAGRWQPSGAGERDAAEEAFCRSFRAADPFVASRMAAYATALSVALAGNRATARPQPLFQAGFEATSDEERTALLSAAVSANRDLVQVSFDADEPNSPTDILMALRDEHGARFHTHAIPWSRPGGADAPFVLVLEGEERCHMVLREGTRLDKVPGWRAEDLDPGADRARAVWEDLAGIILDREERRAPLRRHIRADTAGELFDGTG